MHTDTLGQSDNPRTPSLFLVSQVLCEQKSLFANQSLDFLTLYPYYSRAL